jgi:hypothetical protein
MSTVILVHTGNEFPGYINDCISQLEKYDVDIHLILSERLHPNVISEKITLVEAEDYDTFGDFVLKNHDNSFRDGFWFRTSSRFFLLQNYSKLNDITSFFHIENDVLLYSDLKKEKEILDNTKYEMTIVLDSDRRCVPSILWFKDYYILGELTDFIVRYDYNDDMRNLYLFYEQNRDKVNNFPIIHDEQYSSNNIKYNNLYNKFQCIFDGAAIGQYLFGVDPRNTPGDTSGFINETTIFNPSLFNYIWEEKVPYMIDKEGLRIKINNLHIHSKQLNKII